MAPAILGPPGDYQEGPWQTPRATRPIQNGLEALVEESERLRQCSAELIADMDALRRRMGQLYIDVAPLNRRRRERRK